VLLRVAIAVALLAIAVIVAWRLERQRRPTPVKVNIPIPPQLTRADFPRPDAPWLVVLFSSSTCDSCGPMAEKIKALESSEVAVADIEYHEERALHERYGVEAVPIVLVVDADGVTRKHFSGNATATDLWAAVAEVRQT
jgi:hypothetical protein